MAKKKPIKGTPTKQSQREQAQQVRVVLAMFENMADDVEKEVTKVMTSGDVEDLTDSAMDANVSTSANAVIIKMRRKWDKIFGKLALSYTDMIIQDSKRRTAKTINSTMQKAGLDYTMKVDTMSQRTRDILKAASNESVSQIKTISKNYLDSVASTLNYSITNNSSSFSSLKDFFQDNLKTRYKTHKNKAKNLALDQTRNVFNTLAEQRSRDAGLTKYIWRHAGGSKEPRHYHKYDLNGKTFSYDKPPIIDEKTGQRGNPGQIYNCHCYAEPVIDFTDMD